MFVIGLATVAAVSLASFSLLLTFTTPEGGIFIIGLFFLTFFLTFASIAALVGIFFERRYGTTRLTFAQPQKNLRMRPVDTSFSDSFRRGILLGSFVTLLLVLETHDLLTLSMGVLVFAPFAFIEGYVMRRSPATS